MSKQTKWLCYGDVGIDQYPHKSFVGGISFNHLFHLHKLGELDLNFYGPLSMKDDGEKIKRHLSDLGVTLLKERESLYKEAPPKQVISLSVDGEKKFDSYHGEIFKEFQYKPLLEDFDVILVPAFKQNQNMVHGFLKGPPKGEIIVDLLDGEDLDMTFLEPFCEQVSMVVVGCPPENGELFEKLKESVNEYPWRLLVTRAKEQGFFYDGKKLLTFTPEKVADVVDSTGAGDAFLTAFLHKLYRGAGAQESLAFACFYSRKVLQRVGPH